MKNVPRDVPFDEGMAEIYREDPQLAAEVLNEILADGEAAEAELLIALRHMTKAFGGVAQVAEKAKLNRTQAYRTLSRKGNPAVTSLNALLHSMGMRLAVQPLKAK